MTIETPFSPDHSDRLTVLQLNSNSSKLLTASIDHRVAIYEIDRITGERKQLDVFTAHDAEIRDAKWFHPSTGIHFVTIGNDLQMRIWSQMTDQAPMSGRRFKRIATIKCEQLVPFVSVDVKTVGNGTYIVVIDRQGLLSLYEPNNPDEYHEWSLIDQFHVFSPIPGRGDHTSFRVQFDPNPIPLPYTSSLSEDQSQLSIAVTAMNEVKLYRSTADPDIINAQISSPAHQSSNVGRGASHRLYLFEVLRIQAPSSQTSSSSSSLLRDIAYSPGNIRGSDIIATASMDGRVTIYDVSLDSKSAPTSDGSSMPPTQSSSRPTLQSHQSNLTSALRPNITNSSNQQVMPRTNHPFPYSHHVTLISTLNDAHTDAWSVQWDPSGQVLLSSGSDGVVKMWKRALGGYGTGEFELFAEQTAEEDGSEQGSAEEDE